VIVHSETLLALCCWGWRDTLLLPYQSFAVMTRFCPHPLWVCWGIYDWPSEFLKNWQTHHISSLTASQVSNRISADFQSLYYFKYRSTLCDRL